MKPEFTAHKDGPHSRVNCVECHVGTGAIGFVRAKAAGTRQLVSLTFGTYSRPVPSPVHNLRPANETCEHCHWPERYVGDKIDVISEFGNDEKNTLAQTKMVMHVGGGLPQLGRPAGIHWHANPGNVIEFVATDGKRQEIPYVRLMTPDGKV